MTQRPDRPLAAAALIATYAAIIGFTDNHVRVIAVEIGLWQFHAMRSAMAMGLLAVAAVPLALRLRPRRWRAVVARSVIHAAAMVIYFGALAFLPVAVVAAGLFTAPIFVLLIGRVVYGQPVGPAQGLAVALGFAGVVLVLGPEALSGASAAAVLPVMAGALYAMGNIATRQWCAAESAETLVAGFFLALGVVGALGLGVLTLAAPDALPGAAGFLTRGPAWPGGTVWFWVFVQAAGSLIGVGMMVRGYQMTTAARASVYEYSILPMSALWGWLLWREVLGPGALTGMAMIVTAGALIAGRR